MRTSWRRTWIKLYPIDCLDGSIRYQLGADERGVWYDLLNFAAICSTPGSIGDKDTRAYPLSFVANRLNIDLGLLETTLKKCEAEGRIKIDDHGIHITNWHAYQSEYNRQKPYRKAKDKTKYGEFQNVFLSDKEYAKLVERFGDKGIVTRIAELSEGIASKGYKYTDHYATILSWERKRLKDNPSSKSKHDDGWK